MATYNLLVSVNASIGAVYCCHTFHTKMLCIVLSASLCTCLLHLTVGVSSLTCVISTECMRLLFAVPHLLKV